MENEKPIKLQVDNQEYKFGVTEFTRWFCLLEAIEVIENKAMQLKENLNSSDSWINPIAINHYIDSRQPSMLKDVQYHEKLVPLEPYC